MITGDHGLVGLITLVNVGITLLVPPFMPKIIDLFGKKNVLQFCGLFTKSSSRSATRLKPRKLATLEAHHERPEDFITPDHKV